MPQSILIIGAGIIGSALAYRFSQTTAQVTILDPSDAGGTASAASFGWVNAAYENPRPYYDLRLYAMQQWEHVKTALADLPFTRNGTLYTDFYGIPLQTLFDEHGAWGYPLDWVQTDEIASLEPNLLNPPSKALHCPIEAQILCDGAARVMLNAAIKNGATFAQAKATALQTLGEQITGVIANDTTFSADTTILACGSHTSALSETAGVTTPMTSPPGLLIYTKPAQKLIHHTILTDGLHMQQRPDGTITAGGDFGGGSINDDPENGSKELFSRLASALKSPTPLEFSHHTLGRRPTPKDGQPIVGSPKAGLYITAMHSGATLAAGVAELATNEIVTGERHALLSPFHPDRFDAA